MTTTAVLLATYNGEKYITELLTSLFAQTYQDFTLYVHDDGSEDATLAIIEKFQEAKPGRIVTLLGPSCKSAKANFLWMLTVVNADNYLLCDQDDVWAPNKIELEVARLEAERKNGKQIPLCVFSDMYVTDEKLEVLSDSFISYIGRDIRNIAFTQILIDNPAAGCTMAINRELRDAVIDAKDFVDIANIPMHDVYILELAAILGEILPIDMPLVYYRQTGQNTMGAETETEADKASRNMTDVASGSFIAKKKAFVSEARIFASEILKISWIKGEKRQLLEDFVQIEKESKLKRMAFYRKNNFTRAHHNIWMRLWV